MTKLCFTPLLTWSQGCQGCQKIEMIWFRKVFWILLNLGQIFATQLIKVVFDLVFWIFCGHVNTLGCQINEYTCLFGTKETWRKKQTQRQTKVFNENPPYSFIWPYSFNWHLRVHCRSKNGNIYVILCKACFINYLITSEVEKITYDWFTVYCSYKHIPYFLI